jgi:hypothetical protein
MGDYKPVAGDRVRVVAEGEVESADEHGFTIGPQFPVIYEDDKDLIVSIEKIDPPVVTFKPGDAVRDSRTKSVYSIGRTGYLSHLDGMFYQWAPVGLTSPDYFTSRGFDKVDLG